jgi:hypothetical protein
MHSKDKIIKATWNSFEATKDVVVKNITTAIRDGKIKVDPSSLQAIVSLLGASVEEGFQKSYNVFVREVDDALGDVEKKQHSHKDKKS